jgi:F-type H+/Na+-transporting ATPase subunit alpha
VLKQPQYQPMPAEKEVAILFAGAQGYLDEWPEDAVSVYEKQMLEFMENRHADILKAIKDEKDISDATNKKLKAALDEFKGIFHPAA